MNADSLNAPDRTSSRRVEPARNPRPGRVAADQQLCFEAALQDAASGDAPDAQSGGPDMGGIALCFDGTSTAQRAPIEGLTIQAIGVPAFGSTFGAMAGLVRTSSAMLPVGVPALAAPGRTNQKTGRKLDAAKQTPDSDEAAWKLLEVMATHLRVTGDDKAQHGVVDFELKGGLLAGTKVTLLRQGHRLSLEITASSADGYRALAESAAALRESVVSVVPDCFVDVTVVPS